MRYSSLSLKDVVCRCAAGPRNDEAWKEFVFRVRKPISLSVMRTASVVRTASLWGGASRSVVEDLVQETYLKLFQDGCRHLLDFAAQHPDDEEAILRYIKKTAANATYDHFKRELSKKRGGDKLHVSTNDVEPVAEKQVHASQERIEFGVLKKEIDELLKRCLTGPDQDRDRTIFWLYFRQGMSTKQIASLPSIIGLTAPGAGSVIERLKHGIREQIVGSRLDSDDDEE